MKIKFNIINFSSLVKTASAGKNVIKEYYSDNGALERSVEYDEFNRDVDTKTFDESGEVKEHQHKDYYETQNEKGFVETYKSKSQEYTRKSYIKIEDGLKHSVDDFRSASGKSYINDFVHDLSGNLVKIIANGRVTYLKK